MDTSTYKHVFGTAQKYLPCSSKTEWHLNWKTTWLCWSNGSADSTAISSRYRARASKCSETFLLCTALYRMTNTMAWNTLDRRSFRGSSYAGLHGPGIRNGGQGGPWPLYLPACVTLKSQSRSIITGNKRGGKKQTYSLMAFVAMGFSMIDTAVLEGQASSTFMAEECIWKRWLVPLKHFYTPNKPNCILWERTATVHTELCRYNSVSHISYMSQSGWLSSAYSHSALTTYYRQQHTYLSVYIYWQHWHKILI